MSEFKYRKVYRQHLSPWRVIWLLIKWQFGDYGKRCEICGFYEAAHYNYDLQFDMESYPCTFETMHESQLGEVKQPAPDVQAAVAAALEKVDENVSRVEGMAMRLGQLQAKKAFGYFDRQDSMAYSTLVQAIFERRQAIRAIPRDASAFNEYRADIKRLIDNLNDWFEYEVEWTIVKELKAKYNL